MPWTKVTDIAFGRLRVPDLDEMEEFLRRFGLVTVERTKDAIYSRGTDPVHHIHVVHKGDPKFLGLAYHAPNEDALKALAKAPGASGIEHLDEPGGGMRVRLTEPNGYQIEVVWGMEEVAPLPFAMQKVNTGDEPLRRAGELMRLRKGPSRVKRSSTRRSVGAASSRASRCRACRPGRSSRRRSFCRSRPTCLPRNSPAGAGGSRSS
jgi:catechol 2,3-dioxygenase-like lactoylglutathione lyase family enzyme